MYIVSNVAITLMENSVLILSYAVSIIVKIIKSYNGNQTGLSEIPKWMKKMTHNTASKLHASNCHQRKHVQTSEDFNLKLSFIS